MADAVVSFVLGQLSTLVREESALSGGLGDEMQDIKDELAQMRGFLRRAEAIIEKNFDLEAWVSQVRDVAYDAEDILDEFILRLGRCRYDYDGFLDRVQKVYGSIKNSKARRQLATKIQTIKNRIKYIPDAHQRYQNQLQCSSSAIVQNQNQAKGYDSRDDALLLEEAELVGIERPKKSLMKMLFKGDSQLRFVSVIGMGGLGKTTLVKRVYDDPNVKKRFKHHVWITISQSFRIKALVKRVIQQLFKEQNQPAPDELDRMDTNDMKELVHGLLHQENYILVFDNVWRTINWDAIRMTFPRNNSGSRIVITSRISDVGRVAKNDIGGNIHHLEPLTEEESWTLFCKKPFPVTSCPDHLRKISKDIIERCDGLPLTTVVIAGVLARKCRTTEEWDLFNRSLGEKLAGDDQLDNTRKIISLSYYNLPDDLKICFLYLSILPEDASIKKVRLIRFWIAEGFVPKKEGMTIEEVAEGYLNDLINRSLVQIDKTALDGRLKACRVHDIIHQIILRKAREEGITATVSEQGMEFPAKVRRLAIHNSAANPKVSNDLLKCLRSLIWLDSINAMSKLFQSKLLSNGLRLLKLLDLEGTLLEAIPNEIFKMFQR